MKTPVTGKTLKTHLTYNWWKYVLLILLAIGLTDLLYTVTAYRSPPEKRVEFYIYGYANSDALDAYMEQVRQEALPEMEVMNSQTMLNDASYGPMQLTTYVAAGEGDLYLLPRNEFLNLSSEGAFVPLEDDEALMDIFNQAGISLQSGWRKETRSGETHLYGIPSSKVPGLNQYAYAEDGYLSVLVTGGNTENALTFLRILCQEMLTAPETAETTETAVP